MSRYVFFAGIVAVALVNPASAKQPSSHHASHPAEILAEVLREPEATIDLAKAKLTIDKLIDPKISIDLSLKQIDSMVGMVNRMVGPASSTIHKLAAVRSFIYVAGDWNGHKPFQYDLVDPFGTKLEDKLLPNYMKSRRGNCVSMPVLYIILADRMGVHVTASTAPHHVFVKFIDDASGRTYNLEATSGGLPANDGWYRKKIPMTDEAIANGVYMKTLSKKETVAVMAETLIEYFMIRKRYRDAIAIADVILNYYPNFADVIAAQGTAYAFLIDAEFKQKYPTPADIPLGLRPTYQEWAQKNALAFERAEALGWRAN
ncbi:MAG: hypothetical protein HY243_00975 [Proteobacteria bacterium]|nr:hypothetical protein [Pseudomonadota bacterium]